MANHKNYLERLCFFKRHLISDLFCAPFFFLQGIANYATGFFEPRVEMKGYISTRFCTVATLKVHLEPSKVKHTGVNAIFVDAANHL